MATNYNQSAADVVVIGGGPAGSTVSTLIAQQGRRVKLYEREHFPRFHIGESLIPETYWVFQRLKMLDKMKASPFVKKFSVQFVSANGKLSAPFYFWDNKPHECSQTWQVIRSQFDLMMLQNAEKQGVEVRQGTRVLEVLFEGDRAAGVRIQNEDGSQEEVRAAVVVDASGQSTMLQNRLKLRLWDPVLNKGAIWTYWEGAYRDTGRDEGATLVVQTTNKQGWFWYIPQHDNTVSVGVVAPFDYLFKGRGSHEQTYDEEVEACPAIKERVSIGRRATGYFATKDYSYRSRQVAGDGWVLVGDAFGFLDPLYSSGVLLALKSGEMAADAIVEGLSKGDLSAAQLGKWGPTFGRGVDRMRRLVCEYYDGFSFGKFVKTFPHLTGLVTDLLIGDLFTDSVDAVWEPMESLYPPDKKSIPSWSAAPPPGTEGDKVNELFLPERAEAVTVLRRLFWYAAMIALAAALFLVIDACGSKLMAPQAAPAPGAAPVGGKPDALSHVLVALVAVLATGQLLNQIFRRAGQPPVIGEVIAGILLGPSVLGQVWPEAAAFVLPPSVAPFLGVIAQFGVILYMFLVGLELNHEVLRERAHVTVAISHASIVVPFVFGAALALVLYPTLSGGEVSFTSFALFVGVAMSITAFPVLARILTDRRMHTTRLGIIALGCAAADDLTAWCLLAFVVGVAQARVGGAFIVLALTAAYIALMILVARPILARFLARPDEGRLTRQTTALVFGALLLSALATEAIGIHAIFGAFLLGVIIPHDSTVAHALTGKLEDLVTVLLLPAFFAFTGMRTQIGLVSGVEHWLLCALIILVATAGKFGGTLAAARLTGLGWRDGTALGLLMNTRGLMELIVLNIGLDMKVISPTLFTMMVLMALATTMATTPLLQLLVPQAGQEPCAEPLQTARRGKSANDA